MKRIILTIIIGAVLGLGIYASINQISWWIEPDALTDYELGLQEGVVDGLSIPIGSYWDFLKPGEKCIIDIPKEYNPMVDQDDKGNLTITVNGKGDLVSQNKTDLPGYWDGYWQAASDINNDLRLGVIGDAPHPIINKDDK